MTANSRSSGDHIASSPFGDAADAAPAVPFDPRQFRDALGSFATGITVVTALGPQGQPLGLTVNSFNAVSLEPPLVLWSLARKSHSCEAFRQASHYAVNILALDQEEISQHFAMTPPEERFKGVAWHAGRSGVPILEGCCAWFEVRNDVQHVGGDHLIFVGQVQEFARDAERLPLIFHAGRYRELA